MRASSYFMLLTACIAALCASGADAKVPTAKPQKSGRGGILGQIPINYAVARQRTGWYYLPKGYNARGRTVPVMVAIHGAGGDGRDMVNTFMALADKYRFVIIAPQSHDTRGWQAIQDNGSITPFTIDVKHVVACWKWVLAARRVPTDKERVLALGFSAGGFSAGQYAGNNIYSGLRFTHGAAVHSAFYSSRMGQQKRSNARLWLSTGKSDGSFPPSTVASLAQDLRFDRWSVTYKTYAGGHSLGNKAELEAVTRWWVTSPAKGK